MAEDVGASGGVAVASVCVRVAEDVDFLERTRSGRGRKGEEDGKGDEGKMGKKRTER